MNIAPSGLIRIVALLGVVALGGCLHDDDDDPAPAQPAPDTTAPTVSAMQTTAGAFGATVDRTVTLTVTASDTVGVTEVRFFVDGVMHASDTTSPYTADWDTSAVADGEHMLRAEARDAAGNVGQSAVVTVTVRNTLEFTVALVGEQEVPPADTEATAQATLMINIATGEVGGDLAINGLTATAAHVHDAFAGTNGPILVPLEPDVGDPARFTVPAASMLDEAGIERLLAGALYVNVHTAARPGGEIRGQILPAGFVLRFVELSGFESVPRLETFASGRAGVTLDQSSGAIVVHAQVQGLDAATVAHVHDGYAGENGPVLVPLAHDQMNPAHWFAEGETLNAAGLAAFAAGRLYVNVHSMAHPGGEIRGQIVPEGIALIFTELLGEQEVPLVDTNASGLAALTFDEAGARLTIHANTRRLDDASAAHLHTGYAGVPGPVTIGLTKDGSDPAHWFVDEAALSTAQLDALLAGRTYVNVHSPAYPGGEIRGQVIPDGILFAFGRLEGSQEVPPVATLAGGTFAVTVDPAALTLVAHANTTGADDATAAHLHDGYAGVSGGVAIGLTKDQATPSRWSVVDAPLDADKLAAIRAGRYYVNVHTPANPGGAIRGQVVVPPIEVLFTTMDGTQENPPLASAASALAASTVDVETGSVTLHLNATGADDATAAHIHVGFAGLNGPVRVPLEKDMANAGHWFVIGAELVEADLASYLTGELYVNLHTPANPGGEIRGQIAPPPVEVLFTMLSGDQEVPPVVTVATGLAASTVNRATGTVTLHLRATGADTATAADIHRGAVGQDGPVLIPLEQNMMTLGRWSVTGAQLDLAGLGDYRAGRLYVNLHTPANPDGEIRGQIVPPNAADFDNQAPTVDLTSPGATVSGTVALAADAADDQGVETVRFFVNGVLIASDASAPYSIDWDTTTVANGQVTLTARAEDFAGNVGVSADVVVTVQNAMPVTLTQIQTQVFTPTCSVVGCHSGPTSNVLPTGMNLTSAAASFMALVNVASLEIPSIDRVEPGDPDNSYLIQKLEGTPGIMGVRMPLGGPFLDQPTIDMIRQWISDGALNN